jgi:muconolactone delta-isomerase
MLFLAISTPRPERPSAIGASRQRYWEWLAPLQGSGTCKWTYARTGRGAVAVFDVDSNETLHRLLNEWAEIVPATFDIFPLIDPVQARKFLRTQRRRPAKALR